MLVKSKTLLVFAFVGSVGVCWGPMLHFTTSPGMGQGFRLTAFRKTSRERPSLYKDVEKGSAEKSLLCMLGIRGFLDRSLWCFCGIASESFHVLIKLVVYLR